MLPERLNSGNKSLSTHSDKVHLACSHNNKPKEHSQPFCHLNKLSKDEEELFASGVIKIL